MPLHPLLVHFPIAILLTAAVVEIVNLFLKKENVSRMGTVLVVVGVLIRYSDYINRRPCRRICV